MLYNMPQGLRGYWADAQTFMLESDEIAKNDHVILRMRFEGDRVAIESQETAHELSVKFEGRIEKP